jgi:hypothetical protein
MACCSASSKTDAKAMSRREQLDQSSTTASAEAALSAHRNVAIEYRSAESQDDRLPALTADLVQRRVAVIATIGGYHPQMAIGCRSSKGR